MAAGAVKRSSRRNPLAGLGLLQLCIQAVAVLSFWPAWSAAPVFASEATLRAGDTIELKLGGVPSTETQAVSGEYQIDGEGYVNMPNIGKVKIGGLSPGSAEAAIQNVYTSKQIYTHPTIIITIQPQARFVNVGGEVKNPTRVPYTADLTVLSSINAAGGFSPYADQRKVRLLRGTQVTIIDVKKIRANPALDLPLQPGDNVEVPQSLF